MDPSWMELVLDSIKTYQVQTKQLFEQQKALHLQALNGIVSTEPPAKRRKASKQCYGPDGKENCCTAGTAKNQQSNLRTYSSKRQMQKLIDSGNLERNLNPCQVTYLKETEAGKLGNELLDAQLDSVYHCNSSVVGQSGEVLLQTTSLEKAKSFLSPPKLNAVRGRKRGGTVKGETLSVLPQTTSLEKTKSILSPPKLNPVRGRKCGGTVKGGTLSVASESLKVLPGPERLEKVNDSSELPCPLAGPVPLRMTRARAKTLMNGEGQSVSAQCEKPAKKPRGHKGRTKALPQATSGREVEEFANIVAGMPVTDEKSTRSELVWEGNDGLSGEADELRNESMMNLIDNVETAVREQPVTKQGGRPNIVRKTIPGTREKENQIPVVNLQFPEQKQLGCEAIQLYAEGQSGGEDVPTKEHTKNPDDGTTGSAQKDQQVKMSSPLKDICKAGSQSMTSVCEGVACIPLVVVRDLRIEPTQTDGERKSGAADVVGDDSMEDIVLGRGDTIIVPVEELVKKPRAKRGKAKAAPISNRLTINVAQCIATALSMGEKDLNVDSLNGNGDRHNGVADGVVHEEMEIVVGANYTVVPIGQAKPVSKSAFSYEDEEVSDQVVTGALFMEAEDDTVVTLQVDGRIHRESGQDARNEGVLEAEKEVCSATLQESQPAVATISEVKKPRRGRRQKGRLRAISNKTLTNIDVNFSLEDEQPTEEETVTIQSVEARDDTYEESIEDERIEAKREDEDDHSSADLDSERWEDIKRSVKVRKGRGKAVSSFLGYADSDLFPPRSLAIGRDNVFDLALEQDIENAGSPGEGLKGVMETALPFSEMLQKMEAAAFDSTQKNLQRELELGGGRKDNGEGGRRSGASLGEILMARHITISEEFSVEAVQVRVGTDDIHEPSRSSGKKRVAGIPETGVGLELESGDTGARGSVVTPKAMSQGSGPISESLERSAGAVVSGRGFRHLVKELKLELESTEPRKLNTEIVIDLSPGDRFGAAKEIVQEKPRPLSGYSRRWSHDGGQGEQVGVSTSKGHSPEWTVELTGGPKLVPIGDIKIRSCDKQGLEMFADAQKENVQVDPMPVGALEPNVVSEIGKLPFVSLEQIRRGSGYQGDDASTTQDAGVRGIKLRIRPFSEFCDAKASTHNKVRSVLTSLEGGEYRKLDDGQLINPLESEESLTLDLLKARRVPTAENTSPVDTTPTRDNVSPWKGEPSNRRPPVSSQMKSNKPRAQMAVGGDLNLFKEAFTFKTPLHSQRRKVTEVSADCQPMGETSPSFHVPDARRSCISGSLNSRPSHSHKFRASSRVGEREVGGSGIQTRSTARSPPEELSTRSGLSGGGLRYESTNVSPTPKISETKTKTHCHYDFSSPARVDFRDESSLRRSVDEGQDKSGRYGNFSSDSLRNGGKLGSQIRAVTVTPHGILGHDILSVNVAVSPPQQLRNENWSGDTVVLSDADDQDTLTSTVKSLGSSRQGGKCELPACSPCKPGKLSLSMTVTFEDLNPRKVSLQHGVQTVESDLGVKDIGNSSNSKLLQRLKHGSDSSGTEVKGDRNTVPGHSSVRNTCGSGGLEEKLEGSKRTLHSPLSAEPKRSRLPIAEGPGKSCGRTPVNSEVDRKTNCSKTVDEVTAAESLQQAETDVHSVSTVYVSDEDEGAESSGNTSIESRRISKLSSDQGDGDQDHVLEAIQRLESEDFSGDKEFADEENALKEGAHVTHVEECSGGNEAGIEELVGLRKSSKQRIKSCGRKSTSRKRKERKSPEESYDLHQQDEHRHEAEAHNLSRCSSYEGGGAFSGHGNECSENSSPRRTKVRRTIELLETAFCHVEGYVHSSGFGDLQFKSDYGDCEIADSKTPISSYGKAYGEETSTAKSGRPSETPRTNSNVVNPSSQSTRLLSNVRTLIPVSQRPAPNFIPNGKRDVKVKALEAAEAARRLQEKREIEKRERMQKRAEAIARRAKEKEKAKEEMQKAEQESKAAQKAVSDTTTAKDLSAPMAKAVLSDCTNFKTIQSPKSKSTRAHALKTKLEQEKTRKLEEELKRKEEERKKREAEILARKRKKEEVEKKDREEKRRRQEELLKHRREEEERLRSELEEKEHRHRLLEEAERERKAQEEEARRQRRAERERERERRQKDELEAKAARQVEKEAERKRKEEVLLIYKASEENDHRMAESMGAASTAPRLRSHHSSGLSTDRLQASNLLSTGASLSFCKAALMPSTAFEGRSYMIATPTVQNKGSTSSLSTIKLQSLGTGPTTAGGKNAEMESGPKTIATPTIAALEHGDIGPQSYEISPYRSSSDDEDEDRPQRPKKFIPAWASKENLMPQLLRQLTQDPDEIFAGTKTCSLKEVFGTNGSKKVLDFGRRSGSGDWVKDRVSWKEELQYKIVMGYMSHIH